MHWECRYCDRPAGYMGIPIAVGDEQICACGAEWEDAKMLVETEIDPDEPRLNDYEYENELLDDNEDENDNIYDEEYDDCDLLYMQELKAAEEW